MRRSHDPSRRASFVSASILTAIITALAGPAVAQLSPVARLTTDQGGPDHQLGWSVAVARDLVVVAAPGAPVAGPNSGAVHVFERDESGWHETQRLVADDADSDDVFGNSIATSGTAIVVGAPLDEPVGAGSAYVFERGADGRFRQVQKIVPPPTDDNDRYGWSAAIDGDTIAVGAFYDDQGGTFAGSAHVFERDGGGSEPWRWVANLVGEDADFEDSAGWSVAIDGDVVVVGTPRDEDPAGGLSGSAYVFERDRGGPEAWGQVAKLVAADARSAARFGEAVAVSGDLILVGAIGDRNGGPSTGAVYAFRRDAGGAGAWGQVAKIPPPVSGFVTGFGGSVAFAGGRALIGASGQEAPPRAFLFAHEGAGASWDLVDHVAAAVAAPGDRFGRGVAIGAGLLLVGAPDDPGDGDGAGAAYLFQLPGEVDLAVSLAASPEPVVVGDTLRYAVTVSNLGPGDASGVVLTGAVELPAGVAITAIVPGAGSFAGGLWRVGDLAPGAGAELTVDLAVAVDAIPARDAVKVAIAVAAVDQPDLDPGNDDAVLATSVISRIAGLRKDVTGR